MDNKQWPAVGDKITFKGVHSFWFTNIVQDANDLLELGKEYTIKKLELASSWCGVILEEFPENTFALSFFSYEPKLSTQEVEEDRYISSPKKWGSPIDMSYTKEIDPKVSEKIREMFKNPSFRKVMSNLSKND